MPPSRRSDILAAVLLYMAAIGILAIAIFVLVVPPTTPVAAGMLIIFAAFLAALGRSALR